MDDEIGASRWTGTVRIVVDTSALLAILLQGPERERFLAALLDNDPIISIATDRDYLVLFGRRGAAALDELDRQIAGYRSKSCRLRWMINTVCGKRCSISAKAADGRRRC